MVKQLLLAKKNLENWVRTLWKRPQREYHYSTQELVYKYTKQFDQKDIVLFEFMSTQNPWWSTIVMIAPKTIKPYFKRFPGARGARIEQWLFSDNVWLQRACLVFQLLEKEKTDTALLQQLITSPLGFQEFFIYKAMGWVLRDYGRPTYIR